MMVPESRGTIHHVFSGQDENGPWWSFGYSPGATRTAVSVPIGWQLVPDPSNGVILRGPFHEKVGAMAALIRATVGGFGFRLPEVGDLPV